MESGGFREEMSEKTSTGIGQKVGVKCIRASRVALDMAFSTNNLGEREEWVNDVYDVISK
jgi:hypothetical protein